MGRRRWCNGNVGPNTAATAALLPPPATMGTMGTTMTGLLPATTTMPPSLPLSSLPPLPRGRRTTRPLPLDLLLLLVDVVVRGVPWQIGTFLLLPP